MNRKVLPVLMFFSLIFCTFADDVEMQDGKKVSIRFYTKTVYYPGGIETEPIFVKVSITNNNAQTMHFKLADDRSFTVDFSVVNTRNKEASHNESWRRKRNSNGQIYFREITLEQGETYSFVENIKDYVNIDNAGKKKTRPWSRKLIAASIAGLLIVAGIGIPVIGNEFFTTTKTLKTDNGNITIHEEKPLIDLGKLIYHFPENLKG